MLEVMRNKCLNKEWLSLHQCIDESCRVHHNLNTVHVTSNGDSQELNVQNRNNHLTESSPTVISHQFGKANASTIPGDKKENTTDMDYTVDPIHKSGGFTLMAQDYEDFDTNGSPSENLKTLIHESGNDSDSTMPHTGNSVQKPPDVIKPSFMCTWLNKHIDINNFPFYKLAVQYGNEKRVWKKDAAIYSSLATKHIWTSHKYIGDEDEDLKGEGHIIARDLCSNASRSHENLSLNVETVIKNIQDVDISDLKFKYSFLFDPKYIYVRKNIKNRAGHCGSQNKHQEIQNGIRCSDHIDGKADTNGGGDFYFNGERNNGYCGESGQEKDKQHGQLSHVNYNNYNLNDLASELYKNAQSEYHKNLCVNPTGNIGFIPYEHSSTPIKQRPMAYFKKTPDKHNVHTMHTGLYTDKLHRSTDLPNDVYTYSRGQYYCSPRNVICYTSSPCSPIPHSESNFKDGNVDCQTHVVNSPYKLCTTESPYYNVSPLVSSPAFSCFISPVGHQNSPFTRGYSAQYFTKRNNDPRIQADTKASIKQDNHDMEDVKEDNVIALDLNRFSDSPGQPVHGGYSATHGYQYNVYEENTCARDQRGLRQERHRQCQIQTDNEDPFNGPFVHVNSVGQYNSENYPESPSSEVFYGLNDHDSNVEQHEDDVMDIFYGGNNGFSTKTAIIYKSPSEFRHGSRSSRTSRYYEMKSRSKRYRESSCERFRSRKPGNRRSMSSSTDANRRHLSKHSRHSKSLYKKQRSVEKYKRNEYSNTYNKIRRDEIKESEHRRRKRRKRSRDRNNSRYSRSPVLTAKKNRDCSSGKDRRSSKNGAKVATSFRRYYDRNRLNGERADMNDMRRRTRCARR